MKQKVIIAVLSVILSLLLALGFYLSLTQEKGNKAPAPTTVQAGPGDSTPGITTPGATTPGATTPEVTTPEVTTPAGTTSVVTTPAATTPAATTPGATTPAATTPVPTTPAPTTPAPTTPAPTTPAPTTPAPTTPAPTTPAPTTPAPTTPAPTTPAPTTPAPTTPAPTTPAPTTPVPTTPAPTTPVPTTPAPTTPAPTTPAPTTPAPTTPAPTTPAPTTPKPTLPEPTRPKPTTPAPTTPAPTTPAPTTPAPTTPAPTTPAPTTPAPTTPAPTTPAPTTPAPTTPAPTTPAPTTPTPTTTPHVHDYVGTVTEPTLTTGGYTTYKCSCGDSYVGDQTPVLTLQQHVDRLPLNPNGTGVSELDSKVRNVLSGGSTTYAKLQAVHNFLRGCSHGNTSSSLSQMAAFAGDKVFKNVSELKFAYDANRVFTDRIGRAEHFAAAYAVAARNLGLRSYVVSGRLNGKSHTWCQIYLGEKMYIFDGYNDVFAKLPSEVSGYSGGVIANQSGFQSAGAFTITVQVKTSSGTATRQYTWDVAKAGTTDVEFLQNNITLKLSGKVEYTITVTAQDGSVVIYDHTGEPKQAGELTGVLTPAPGKYTLVVEEQTSGRSFLITVDN